MMMGRGRMLVMESTILKKGRQGCEQGMHLITSFFEDAETMEIRII
jgi:hypothetical protein